MNIHFSKTFENYVDLLKVVNEHKEFITESQALMRFYEIFILQLSINEIYKLEKCLELESIRNKILMSNIKEAQRFVSQLEEEVKEIIEASKKNEKQMKEKMDKEREENRHFINRLKNLFKPPKD